MAKKLIESQNKNAQKIQKNGKKSRKKFAFMGKCQKWAKIKDKVGKSENAVFVPSKNLFFLYFSHIQDFFHSF